MEEPSGAQLRAELALTKRLCMALFGLSTALTNRDVVAAKTATLAVREATTKLHQFHELASSQDNQET